MASTPQVRAEDIALDEKALPCPFCGTKEIAAAMGNDGGGWYAGCVPCQMFARSEDTLEFAVAAWNRRTAPLPSATTPSALLVDMAGELDLMLDDAAYEAIRPYLIALGIRPPTRCDDDSAALDRASASAPTGEDNG